MIDHFTRPIQSDRNREAFSGGQIEPNHIESINEGPWWLWALVGLAAAGVMLAGMGVFA